MSLDAHHAYSALLKSAVHRLSNRRQDAELRALSQLVQRFHARLSRPPRILLLGEVNAGKSSLANLLIGDSVVPTSVVANTRFPIRFHYSPRPTLSALHRDGRPEALLWSEIGKAATLPVARIDVGLAIERLKTFEVVDMPGIGNPQGAQTGIERQHPLTHLPIFCTAATRAWKESERRAWASMPPKRRARGILAVTHADLLSVDDLSKVTERLRTETSGLFRAAVPMALPNAIKASVVGPTSPPRSLWETSGGAPLEFILSELLSEIAEQRVAAAKRALGRALARKGIFAHHDGGTRMEAPNAISDLEAKFVTTLLSTDSLLDRFDAAADLSQQRKGMQTG